jgi:hypothetical protein
VILVAIAKMAFKRSGVADAHAARSILPTSTGKTRVVLEAIDL